MLVDVVIISFSFFPPNFTLALYTYYPQATINDDHHRTNKASSSSLAEHDPKHFLFHILT